MMPLTTEIIDRVSTDTISLPIVRPRRSLPPLTAKKVTSLLAASLLAGSIFGNLMGFNKVESSIMPQVTKETTTITLTATPKHRSAQNTSSTPAKVPVRSVEVKTKPRPVMTTNPTRITAATREAAPTGRTPEKVTTSQSHEETAITPTSSPDQTATPRTPTMPPTLTPTPERT